MLAHPVRRDAVPVSVLMSRICRRADHAQSLCGEPLRPKHDAAQRDCALLPRSNSDYVPAHLLLIDEGRVEEAVARLQVLIHQFPDAEGSEAVQLMLARLLLAARRQKASAINCKCCWQ